MSKSASVAERAAAAGVPDLSAHFTVAEIAALPGYPKTNTLLKYIREGRLPAVKVGRSYMVDPADLRLLVSSPVVSNGGADDA